MRVMRSVPPLGIPLDLAHECVCVYTSPYDISCNARPKINMGTVSYDMYISRAKKFDAIRESPQRG